MSDAFRRSLSWVRSIMGRLHSSGPGLYFRISSKKQSRAVATATLFGVVLSAAIAFTLAPGLKAVATLPATQSTGPIRMVAGPHEVTCATNKSGLISRIAAATLRSAANRSHAAYVRSEQRASPGMDWTPARTNALLSRRETGKMTASVLPIVAG